MTTIADRAQMERLKQRADFVAAAGAARIGRNGFVLQCRSRGDAGPPRVGFTVSRKVGTAVERNRVRRRLREAVRLSAADWISPGNDYVLVGRRAALTLHFEQLIGDLAAAAAKLKTFAPTSATPKTNNKTTTDKIRATHDAKASPKAI